MKRPRASTTSSALLITLVFMALITIVLVGFLSSMRINRPAAYLFMERNRASYYAQDGIASSIATLDQIVLHTNQAWISQPGQLMLLSGSGNGATLVAVPLSSSTNTSLVPSAMAGYPSPDLNIASSRDSTDHFISNTGGSLYLNWIYVTQDGTRSQYLNATNSYQWEANPSFNPTTANPIVGRFAYWTDDESTKINVNTAWGRADAGNADLLSSPTMVDLTALGDSTNQVTQAMANGLHSFLTTNSYATLNNPFFDSPQQARQLASSAAAIKHFKGELTSYNHDPGLNMFGQPRFVLTTRPDRAGWTYNGTTWVGMNGLPGDPGTTNAGIPYFLRLMTNEGTISAPNVISGSAPNVAADPGLPGTKFTNFSNSHLNNTMNTLVSYITNTTWPVTSSTNSFATKFYPVGANASQGQYPNSAVANARCAQLALNIIDYVRSKESPQQIVPPLRVDQTVTSTNAAYSFYTTGSPQGNTFFGSTRAPQISELGVWQPDGTSLSYVLGYLELYNPVNYGIVNYSMPTGSLTGYMEGLDASKYSSPYNSVNIIPNGTSTTMNPGDYKVVRIVFDYTPALTVTTRPAQAPFRFYLGIPAGYIGFAPYNENISPNYGTNTTAFIELPLGAVGGPDPLYTTPKIQTAEIDDPRLSSHTGAWQWHSYVAGQANNTLNAANSNYLTNADIVPTSLAQQDTTSGGNLSDASFYMPPPAGTTVPISYYTYGCPVNPVGYVTSLGELGYIHTGIESDTVSYSNPTSTSTATLVAMPVGTPWRTLRLQPNKYADTTVVPDWALLDLFAVPVTYNPQGAAVLTPNGNTLGGRVNLNASLQPTNFDSARTMPLQAVFLGATNSYATGSTNTIATAQLLSGNIINDVLSPTTVNGTGKNYPATSTTEFLTSGQIAEIQGISDSGESSEENFRQVIGQMCTRGDVFTVYSVGQALKVSPIGSVSVTGEQRLQTMVERYQDPLTGAVSLRTTYYRSVVP